MAASDQSKILRVPTRLVVAPTDKSLPFPYGGTELGLIGEANLAPNQLVLKLHEESYGEETIDALDVGMDWELTVTLRGLDPDALNVIFPSTAPGPVSGRRQIAYPNATYRAGRLLSSSAVSLLLAPLDVANHPCVFFPTAIPVVASSTDEVYAVARELTVMAMFHPIRNSNGVLMTQGRFEDLDLSGSAGGGSQGMSWTVHTTVTTTTTLDFTATIWPCSTAGGPFTVYLPSASLSPGTPWVVKKVSSDNNVLTIAAQTGHLIDGLASVTMQVPQTAYVFVSDGNNWTRI